jgi:hypothetical protein
MTSDPVADRLPGAGRRNWPCRKTLRARMAEAVEAGMRDMDWSGIADYTLTKRVTNERAASPGE